MNFEISVRFTSGGFIIDSSLIHHPIHHRFIIDPLFFGLVEIWPHEHPRYSVSRRKILTSESGSAGTHKYRPGSPIFTAAYLAASQSEAARPKQKSEVHRWFQRAQRPPPTVPARYQWLCIVAASVAAFRFGCAARLLFCVPWRRLIPIQRSLSSFLHSCLSLLLLLAALLPSALCLPLFSYPSLPVSYFS